MTTGDPRATAARPFRDLCPEADARDAMDDGEFWEHVARNLGASIGEPDDMPPDIETTNQATPLPALRRARRVRLRQRGTPDDSRLGRRR